MCCCIGSRRRNLLQPPVSLAHLADLSIGMVQVVLVEDGSGLCIQRMVCIRTGGRPLKLVLSMGVLYSIVSDVVESELLVVTRPAAIVVFGSCLIGLMRSAFYILIVG